jgi:hypothetical protein
VAMDVAFGTGMLIGWIRVRYVPHDEGDGTGSENVHNDIQRSYSLLTLSRQDSLSSRITYRITEQGRITRPSGVTCTTVPWLPCPHRMFAHQLPVMKPSGAGLGRCAWRPSAPCRTPISRPEKKVYWG